MSDERADEVTPGVKDFESINFQKSRKDTALPGNKSITKLKKGIADEADIDNVD